MIMIATHTQSKKKEIIKQKRNYIDIRRELHTTNIFQMHYNTYCTAYIHQI